MTTLAMTRTATMTTPMLTSTSSLSLSSPWQPLISLIKIVFTSSSLSSTKTTMVIMMILSDVCVFFYSVRQTSRVISSAWQKVIKELKSWKIPTEARETSRWGEFQAASPGSSLMDESVVMYLWPGGRPGVHLSPRTQPRGAREECLQVTSRGRPKGRFSCCPDSSGLNAHDLRGWFWCTQVRLIIIFQDHAPGLCPTHRRGSGPESLRWSARLRRTTSRLCPCSAQKQEDGRIFLDPDWPRLTSESL